MKQLFLNIFLLFFSFSIYAQQAFTVYLIGDAGENAVSGKALIMLKEQLLSHPNSAVVFLGDNAYPSGLKKDNKTDEAHLESQLQILNEYKGQVYFIPGNHDWQAQGLKGLQTLKNQQEYIETYFKKNATVANKKSNTFLPHDGLPGPTTLLLENKLRLIIIDTQWFLHLHKKNKIGTKKNTEKIFYSNLDSILNFSKKNEERVVIAAHHPMYTNGQHSKNKQPLRFLINYTPFKIIGWAGLNRLLSQDMSQPSYKKMRTKMLTIFNQYGNIIYASGHDHNLQCFKKDNNRYIVSGAGSKLSHLQKNKKYDSSFQDDSKTGFVTLEYLMDGTIITTVYRVGELPKIVDGF